MFSNTARGCGRGRGVNSSNLEPKQELRRPFANSVDSLETQIRIASVQFGKTFDTFPLPYYGSKSDG